ncbi:MAG: cytochrome P450, partial [Chloroflexi bacterium]|nr:cytochrome P450 [Chloroflexota bacterium]
LSAPLLASMYLGDTIGFALYSMASQPDLYRRIQAEADAIFADGDPDAEVFQGPDIDVTRRFVLECLRMYPVVPGSLRRVKTSCVERSGPGRSDRRTLHE